MYIQLLRLRDNGSDTIGTMHVDGKFECFTLEDKHNDVKVYGQTRIPSGTYNIVLRKEGGMTRRYKEKYGNNHKGMLWLQDVPGFEYVYIHIGNDEEDTLGCILLGETCDSGSGTVGRSRIAYQNFYRDAIDALDRNEELTIQII